MGLASISWNSVRVFSKLGTGLFRVLYHGARFGTEGVSLMHIVLWAQLRTQDDQRLEPGVQTNMPGSSSVPTWRGIVSAWLTGSSGKVQEERPVTRGQAFLNSQSDFA